jgi:hypothetical protein
MKVTVVASEDEKFTVKITVPKKWRDGPASRLIDFIVETYNKRDLDKQIDEATHHLEIAKGSGPMQIHKEAIISTVICHHDTIRIKPGAPAPMAAHSPKTQQAVKQPKTNSSGMYKTIASWNEVNPDYPTQAGGVARTITRRGYKPRKEVVNGVECAHCVRWGCQKRFQVQNNEPTTCSYHTQNVCYRDRGAPSFWKCCPDLTVAENFPGDDLLQKLNAIPGCMTGAHWDGGEEGEGEGEGKGRHTDEA